MRSILTRGIALAVTIAVAFLFNFWGMPAWNLQSAGFWFYWILVLTVGSLLMWIADEIADDDLEYKITIGGGILVGLILVVVLIGGLTSSLFQSSARRHTIAVENGNFEEDVLRVQRAQDIPIVDMITARQLGDRTMGAMERYQSQFEVDGEYNLIGYQGSYYRISPLNYGSFWKYRNSRNTGIPGYVLVNIYTQEARFVELEQTIRYSPSASFEHLLKRHLRKAYPSAIFGKEQFEIDEEGTPYWIVPIERPTAGMFGATVINRVILVNAVTGSMKDYALEDVPEWVDHVFGVSYLMERVNWYYTYVHGYINFSNRDVRKTSYSFDKTQYYFVGKDDDVYLYTGITSAGKDESNFGFILANTRTGEIRYYSDPGAEESSAQASAEGVVQQFGYRAGPVMLVNIDGMPTYFMTLKDNQQLVKKVALVNKNNYTIVVVEDNIERAVSAYRQRLSGNAPTESASSQGVISELYTAIKSGDTHYYFKIQGSNHLYVSSINNSDQQVTMQIGDTVIFESIDIGDNTSMVTAIRIR